MKMKILHLLKYPVINYQIDNLVQVLIPSIDRTGSDVTRLPAKIISIKEFENGHKLYELLTNFGVWTIA